MRIWKMSYSLCFGFQMMSNYGCHTTPMPPSVGDVFFCWHGFPSCILESRAVSVFLFRWAIQWQCAYYVDDSRSGYDVDSFWSDLLTSQWYGCWSTEILQFFSTMTTQILKVAIFLESMVTCAGNFFSKAMRCGVKYLVPLTTLLSTDFGCKGSLL